MFITQFRHNGEILSVTPDGQGARKNICTHGILTENTLYLQTWEKVFVDKTTRWSQTKNVRYLHTKEGVAAHQRGVLAELQSTRQHQ